MKLFDSVSEDVKKALESVEDLALSSGPGYTKELEGFFLEGRRLGEVRLFPGEPRYVALGFKRNVPDGVLGTSVLIGCSQYQENATISITLYGDGDYSMAISNLEFGPTSRNVSPKTVRYVHNWVRDRGRTSFFELKEAIEADSRMRDAIRAKYKPS